MFPTLGTTCCFMQQVSLQSLNLRAPLILLLYFDVNPAVLGCSQQDMSASNSKRSEGLLWPANANDAYLNVFSSILIMGPSPCP